MKLSRKIITLILIAFAITVLTVTYISKTFLMNHFVTLEINKADSGVSRIIKFIQSDVDTLDAISTSYGHWDETYNYINNGNHNYIDRNFTDLSSFIKVDANIIIIAQTDGTPKFIKTLNCATTQTLDEYELKGISKRIASLLNYNSLSRIRGIYMTYKGPLLLTCQPIIDSKGLKPSNGYFILAKFLDQGEISEISSIVGESFTIHNYVSADFNNISQVTANNVSINNMNPDKITGYGVIKDIFGTPALTVELSLPKDILVQANSSMHFYSYIIAVIFILFVLIVLNFLENIVLKRISYIQNTVNTMSSTRDLSLRIVDHQNDEISELSERFNSMFDHIQETNMQLMKSERKYSSLFSNMMAGFMYCRVILNDAMNPVDFEILEINNSFAAMFKKSREAIVNKLGLKLLPDEIRSYPNLMHMINQVAVKGTTSMADTFYDEKYDSWFYLTIYGIEKNHFAMMLTDITDKQLNQKKIMDLAYYDELTRLPNRKKLKEELQIILDQCSITHEKFALLFVDLDNFKSINDSLGHEVGDYVLEKTASRFKHLVDENVLLGRLGGDEFIIVLRNLIHESQAEMLANRLSSLMKPVINYKGSELYIGASIGISIYPDDGSTLSHLMRNADAAMYAAKRNGGYSYELYSRGMNDFALTELIMEGNLRKALDNNEIVIYYQPIVNLKTMKTIGAEALIRWMQNGTLVPPNQFIPLAKNIGVIVSIDNWVLKAACKQCSDWQKLVPDLDFYISINTSYKQIKEPDFIKTVIRAYESASLDPSCLNLEITEDEAMEDAELTISILEKLKAKGITAAMDDFGTGYSSLSYVNRLPIDILKIDRSLISTIDKDIRALEIVRTIMLMCHSLGINILAEGVERESQLEILQDFGCDLIQGYIISKPVPAEEFESRFL